MADPSTSDVIDYVRSSARLLELPLTEVQAERVAAHLARTRAIAALLRDVPLESHDEIAEVFRPAPFPAEDPT